VATASIHSAKPKLEEYTAETFRPYVGQVFTFLRPEQQPKVSAGRVELELLLVSTPRGNVVTAPSAGSSRPFSLLFALKQDMPVLTAGLHRLSHDSFEECDCFLSRVYVPGRDSQKPYYEAVFG